MSEDDDYADLGGPNDEEELGLKFHDEYNLSLVETGGVVISDIGAPTEESKAKKTRKRKQPGEGATKPKPSSVNKLARLQKTHTRITNKAASNIASAAFDLYASSTLKEARDEAERGQVECIDALRKIRSTLRETQSAPPLLAEHAKLVKKIKKSSSDRDQLLDDAATTIEKMGRDLRRLEEAFESLAESFGKNSARCLAATKNGINDPSRLALVATPVTHSAALLAPSDNQAIASLISNDKKKLALVDEYQHPRVAMVIGSDGSATIGASTRPGRLTAHGKPGTDYIAYSWARSQLVPTSKAAARSANRVAAGNRVAAKKAQTENYMRTQLATEETLTKANLLAAAAAAATQTPQTLEAPHQKQIAFK